MPKMREEEVRPGASVAEPAGATTPDSAAQPSAAGTCRAGVTTASDSAHPSDWRRDDASRRVNRGGSLYYYAWNCRAAYRNWDVPGKRDSLLGFRPSFRLENRWGSSASDASKLRAT